MMLGLLPYISAAGSLSEICSVCIMRKSLPCMSILLRGLNAFINITSLMRFCYVLKTSTSSSRRSKELSSCVAADFIRATLMHCEAVKGIKFRSWILSSRWTIWATRNRLAPVLSSEENQLKKHRTSCCRNISYIIRARRLERAR